MKVNSFCVFDFRSVENSGWIDCNEITTLVGVNESGKTNILNALWKFNPVSELKIDILHDIPVTKLSEFRNKIEQIKFISVKFDICSEDVRRLEELSSNTIKGLE